MSSREIKERNVAAMSVLSSLTSNANSTATARRTAVLVNVAKPEDVESVKTGTTVRPEHIVKIFTGNNDFIEVTPEQVEQI
jgi:hypothetical protein